MYEFKNRNVRLKNKVAQCNKELAERDKVIHELLDQISSTKPNTSFTRSSKNNHLANALKKQVRETRDEIRNKEKEMKKLMKSLKVTRIQEMEVEIKMFADECTRLKHIIEEVANQKAASYTPEDVVAFENKIAQQDAFIAGITQDNTEIAHEIEKKEKEVAKWNNVITKLKKKLGKFESEVKENAKNRKQLNETKHEIQRLKEQLITLKSNFKDKDLLSYKQKIEELLKKNNELTEKLTQKENELKKLEPSNTNQELAQLHVKAQDCIFTL